MDMINSAKFTARGLNNDEARSRERLKTAGLLYGGGDIEAGGRAPEQLQGIRDRAQTNLGDLKDADLNKIVERFGHMQNNGDISDPTFFTDLQKMVGQMQRGDRTINPARIAEFISDRQNSGAFNKLDNDGKEALGEAITAISNASYDYDQDTSTSRSGGTGGTGGTGDAGTGGTGGTGDAGTGGTGGTGDAGTGGTGGTPDAEEDEEEVPPAGG